MSEPVSTERRRDVLHRLDERLRHIDDPAGLAYASAELLGEALGVCRVGYGDIDAQAGTITVGPTWSLPGLPDVAGQHDFAAFGSYIDALRAGEPVMVADIETDPRTATHVASFRALGIRAFLDAPVMEQGLTVAEVFAHAPEPRVWTGEDVVLAREVAARTRVAIARRKAEAALREREARYRALFEAIDEGFCIIEFLDGPQGPMSDYVHVEANPAYMANAGIADIVGKKLSDIVSAEEARGWAEIYRAVLVTGEPVRFERELVETGRHLELAAFRVEPADRRQVAVLFKDVTARVQADRALRASEARKAALVKLNDAIRAFENIDDLAYVAAEILGRTLGASRVGYATIDPDRETLLVKRDWNAPGVQSLAGVLQLRDYGSFVDSLKKNEFIAISDVRKDERTAAAATALESRSARSFVNVPVVEQDRLRAVLYVNHAEVRNWSSDELALVKEVAERTRTAVERSRADAALRESEARFRALVNASSDVVYRMSADWTEMRQLDGRGFLADTDGPSVNWLDAYVFPEDRPHVMAAIGKAMKSKSLFELEHRVRRADGSVGWTFSRAVPVLGADGDVIEWFGMAGDVSERKRIEADLAASRATLQAVYDNTPAGLIVAELPSGRLVEANRALQMIFRQPMRRTESMDEYGGWESYDTEGRRTEAQDYPLSRTFATGEAAEGTYRFVRGDGTRAWLRIQTAPIRDASGAMTGGVVAVTDVDEMMRAREALERFTVDLEAEVAVRTRERDRIWAMTDDLVGTAGPDGTLKSVNPAWTRILGWSEAELLGRPFLAIVDPNDHASVADMWTRLAAGHTIGHYFHGVLTHTGHVRVIAWTAVSDPDTGLFYVIGRDETDKRQTEEALRQSQKMDAVGQLTGGIAHDFNNLLTIIKSSSDLLRRQNLAEDRKRRYIDAISDTVDRAAKLTGQLLAFARRQALKPEVFDAAGRIRAVTDMLATIVGSRVRIVSDFAPEPCFIEADVSQFETALVNMAVNARDAMDGEGVLTVRVAPAIHESQGKPGSFIAFAIGDTGGGIAPNRLAHIFEPFYTTKEVGKGTGLGLSQVYGFAKQSAATSLSKASWGAARRSHFIFRVSRHPSSMQRPMRGHRQRRSAATASAFWSSRTMPMSALSRPSFCAISATRRSGRRMPPRL